MVWSFSRLNAYHNCPYEWKMKYLCGSYGISSAMAEFGKFIHKILEMYFNGEIGLFELPIYYEDHYEENVKLPFPHNNYVDLADKYYTQGLEYLEYFTDISTGYDVLGVEKEVRFFYEGYEFVGYIDLLLRDKKDGKIVICDHKSAALKILKSGKISKTDLKHFDEFKTQLYIYSHAILEEFGEDSVKELQWNLFRIGTVYSVPWKRSEYKKSMNWAINTIHEIEADQEWKPNNNRDFYCYNLCSQRLGDCPYREFE